MEDLCCSKIGFTDLDGSNYQTEVSFEAAESTTAKLARSIPGFEAQLGPETEQISSDCRTTTDFGLERGMVGN